MEKQLPKNWVETNLFDISNVITGKKDANHSTEEGEYTFFTCAFEPLRSPDYDFEDEVLILPGNGANVGHVFYFNGKFQAYQRTYIVEKIKIHPKYLFYHFSAFWRIRNENEQFGTATNYIKIGNFKSYSISVAPLLEQHRITAKLDKLFAQLETIKTSMANIPLLLKDFRQQVLTQAVTGKLTEEWRKGKELDIENELRNLNIEWISTNNNLPKTWRLVTVNQYLNNEDSARNPISQWKRSEIQGNYPYYGATGIIDYVDDYTHDGEYILISEDGKNLVYRTKPISFLAKGKIWVNNHAHVLSSKKGFQNNYMIYFFNSFDLSDFISGIDQVKLSQRNLNLIEVPVPPMKEQQEIVRRVESLFAKADAIEQQYKTLKASIVNLPQALLHKAFKGELTEQLDSDGDARELLKQIQELKTSAVKPKKATAKKVKNYPENETVLGMVAEE